MDELSDLQRRYAELKERGPDLDLSRGKPPTDVLDLSNDFLGELDTYLSEDGTDIRNYGVATGLSECRRMLSDLLGVPADYMILGNNSSLSHMYNVFFMLQTFGINGSTPWSKEDGAKILCPVPGYDRHFAVTEDFGVEMIPVPMTDDGPDMDAVERLAAEDARVKAIWCIPLYSNPEGVVYSDETVSRLASMKTADPHFRIFWDNAYGVHHIFDEHRVADVFALSESAGNPDRVFYYFSTSKINFPGGGVGLVASSPANTRDMLTHIGRQTIGYDKITQLRTVKFFDGKAENIKKHMKDIAKLLRPRFELVIDSLDKAFEGTDIVTYKKPKGGYFLSLNVPDGCAKRVVRLAKEAGVKLTPAGATWPCGKDPKDRNIRIAPTCPTLAELETIMPIFCLCVKLAAAEKRAGSSR
ncbi:MAG: aminotransferase class I/II-fold pyridoxal phosphate-dependent enzyme [Clostridiales Family XIII bacterium]|jgi:DNA-binding transcriptional MocR family regulator|nr:aminotransferase class I/II-fold pyridoxal phosphate-dependent enzyme [Clostridiales Family XIII bacterium]